MTQMWDKEVLVAQWIVPARSASYTLFNVREISSEIELGHDVRCSM